MAANIISLLTDSDSSDVDSHIPRSSNQCNLISKACDAKKLLHSLSESDLSGEEENKPNERKVVTKRMKLTSAGPSIVKTNKKKQESPSKLELKQWKDKLKCIKPKECLKYISVAIPEHFSATVVFLEVFNTLTKNGFKYEMISSDENAITWVWRGVNIKSVLFFMTVGNDDFNSLPGAKPSLDGNQISSEFSKTSHLAVIWHVDYCISLIQRSGLVSYFTELMKKKPNQRIYLVLHGTQKDIRDKNVKNEMDHALCELELTTGITHSKFYSPYDLANFFLHLSKSVSQELYRAELEKLEQEKTFYLNGRSQNCVKVDRDNNGMKRLWIQQIAAIYRLPLDSAKVICAHHPTPYCLYETYKRLSTVKEKRELLQEILVGRGGAKRLGPKMSGKIALLFANSNGDLHLSDWN